MEDFYQNGKDNKNECLIANQINLKS